MTATARVDPRMRDRRVGVLREQGRRRLRVVLVGLGALAVAGGGFAAVHSPVLDIDHVEVRGTHVVTEEEVRAAAAVDVGDALLLVDTAALERRIEAIPVVGDARVERRLPGTLRVRIDERVPSGWVRVESGVVIVDGDGRVLETAAEAPGSLPELVGLVSVPAPGEQVEPRAVATVPDELPVELATRVQQVVLADDTVTLLLHDGPEVRLGPPSAVAAKGAAALAVLRALGADPVAYLDVRVPEAPVTG